MAEVKNGDSTASDAKENIDQITDLQIAKESDIVFYSGRIAYPNDFQFKSLCRENVSFPKVTLILVTLGGDAHAAYKIGRGLQQYYDQVEIFIPSWCKSAGTLLCTSANTLYIGDFGELGPVDVQ